MAKHKKKDTVEIPKSWLWAGAFAVIIIIAFMNLNSNDTADGNDSKKAGIDILDQDNYTEPEKYHGEQVKLSFYVMSQCPYGTQVIDTIAPIKEELGDALDLNIDYILYSPENYAGKEDQYCIDGMCSMHGIREVKGDIVQLCAMKYNPDKALDMIVCQNKDAGQIPDNWEKCASENGLDVENIRSCYESQEGIDLLKESSDKASAKGATGSPTIYLREDKYTGRRSETDFLTAICNAFEEKPDACDDIPEPVKVKVIALTDDRCDKCDTTGLLSQLKAIFPGLEAITYDYKDAEGKKIYEESGLEALPALLFDESVKEDPAYPNVESYLVPAGKYSSLRIGATFDPTAEICDNGKDDTGNGKIDCDDPTCKDTMLCREEIEQHLQVFIMSDCPYGKLAVLALDEVAENFGDDMDYEIHYIANKAGSGFSSLHGQYEVDEDIIQLCIKKYSPAVWMDYMACRSAGKIKGVDWKKCATDTGVAIEKVQACFDGTEGKNLLAEDMKLAKDLGIAASPTWLANNKYKFSGINAETVKQNFCSHNEDLEGCSNTLSSETGAPTGSCG